MLNQLLTPEDWYRWQQLQQYLVENQFDEQFIDAIQKLAIASSYALNQLSKQPQWLTQLADLEHLNLDDFTETNSLNEPVDITRFKYQLRQYRHLKLVQIIYLDVVRHTAQRRILRYLSDLADLLIRQTLSTCEKQLADKHGQPIDAHGEPMRLNMIAMGKLGGRELNFSSDIDLIACYADDGNLQGFGHLSYHEFFTRTLRLFCQCLNDRTENGFVYRVDLRLRPWGDSGPLVFSHAGLEHYYQLHGREWEQYAMVKARIITGSPSDKSYLASILRPFVYRKYHDYGTFAGLAALKDKINRQACSHNMDDNIKLGAGGIREIEFFVQAFQILKGGRNNQLQTTEIYQCFDVLEKQAIIPAKTVKDLREAYDYLRQLENRMQMLADQQTHSLPQDSCLQNRLANTLSVDNWPIIAQKQQAYRQQVSKHFNELFKRDNPPETPQELPEFIIDDNINDTVGQTTQLELIRAAGVQPADNIQQQLNTFLQTKAWHFMSARAKQRFTLLLPKLLVALPRSRQPTVLFERLLNLFSAIAGRSAYFELLYQSRALLAKLCDLFDKSEWIAQESAQFPMLLEPLIDDGSLSDRFNPKMLASHLSQQLENVANDAELELDVLRLFKREQTLIIASTELAGEISAIEAGRYLSELAEILLNAVYQLAQKIIEKQYGLPQYENNGEILTAEFAIIGYGKLGGREMHYQSDLDIIFLHDSHANNQQSNGPKTLDNSAYFARLAQKIIAITSILTGSGKLYAIDSRLRPEGNSGLLVSSIQAFQQYQLEKAWTWEHQALVRARPVAGSSRLGRQFLKLRRKILCQPRDADKLAREIINMRDKIDQVQKPLEDECKNLKHSRGCMIDIEFMVQYWVLLHANKVGSISAHSDNISLLNELIQSNIIPHSHLQLVNTYLTYHRYLHETVLQNKPAEISFRKIKTEVTQVLKSWKKCFSLATLE